MLLAHEIEGTGQPWTQQSRHRLPTRSELQEIRQKTLAYHQSNTLPEAYDKAVAAGTIFGDLRTFSDDTPILSVQIRGNSPRWESATPYARLSVRNALAAAASGDPGLKENHTRAARNLLGGMDVTSSILIGYAAGILPLPKPEHSLIAQSYKSRQLQIGILTLFGCTNQAIAGAMQVGLHTPIYHLRQLRHRLGIRLKRQTAQALLERGLMVVQKQQAAPHAVPVVQSAHEAATRTTLA
jgi:DNA-binding CsgD family transcriptional regulator